MRELASEAEVSFATPFNHFGGKGAVLQALSARVIGRMADRFDALRPSGDAVDRTLAMGEIAVALLLERPAAYRAVVASLGTEVPSEARSLSRDLWSLALGDLDGLDVGAIGRPPGTISEPLAYMFRGCLSFWIAGEIQDDALATTVRKGLTAVLLGFAAPPRRGELMTILTAGGADRPENLPPKRTRSA